MNTIFLVISLIALFYAFILAKKTESINWSTKTIYLGFISIVILWFLSGFLLYSLENRGSFGDMFGAINSLFSGLAFGGLIYANLLQNKDLKLQFKELQLTREELRGQKETLQAHNQQIELQNFEGTFFQLLKLHNELLDSIDSGSPTQNNFVKGRDCLQHLWESIYCPLYGRKHSDTYSMKPLSFEQHTELLRLTDTHFRASKGREIFHYFRSLYNIIKLIDHSSITDKTTYINIIRAQLSTYELLLIFYNCHARPESKFTPLIEKYALFKHIDPSLLLHLKDRDFFNSSAYGNQ